MEPPPPRIVPPSRRRDKPVLSCTLCRRRKLKCDRQQPCKTCIDRGLSASCTFVRSVPMQQESRVPSNVHERIDQLEKLVTTLMSSKDIDPEIAALANGSPVQHQEQESSADIPGTPDRVKISNDMTSYTNSGHWTSILDGISELKEHLDQIPMSPNGGGDTPADLPGPDILFGQQRHATKQDLLAALPPRAEADSMISAFFGSMDTIPTLIHGPSFMRQYEKFWCQPFETPTMWVGQLYAMLAIGSRFQASNGEIHNTVLYSDPLSTARLNFYREKSMQALILANYAKCPPHTLEAMMMYYTTEFVRSPDSQFGMWLFVGMIVRIAFRMGYHRDPSRFTNISVFTAELRRRTWLVVLSLDLVSSTQVGLPRMIQPFMYDTHEPRNIDEDGLFEGITELPPARPDTELTPLLHTIVLSRVRMVHAKIMDMMNSPHQPPYKDVMTLDGHINHVYDNLPEAAKPLPAEAFDTPADLSLMRRLYLGLSFHKAKLALHRPYLLLGRTEPKFEFSRRTCLNAAYEILVLQQRVDKEIRPGGLLWNPGWQIFTMSWYLCSIVAQDFLLATTILVSDLDGDLTTGSCSMSEPPSSGLYLDREPPTQNQKIDILRRAQKIWHKASKRSHDAYMVAEAITLVLNKANSSETNGATPASQTQPDQKPDASPAPSFDLNEFSADPANAAYFHLGNANYSNSLWMEEMPMQPGPFGANFNWSQMPQTSLNNQYPPQLFH